MIDSFSILILGGYGNFGRRIAERLSRHPKITLIIAGRSISKAEVYANFLTLTSTHKVNAIALDTLADGFTQTLKLSGAQLLINASGPFQDQDYAVAEACIVSGIHYIDIADGRSFVSGFSSLTTQAKQNNVFAVTGASTVPGLSSAVIDAYLPKFSKLRNIHYGISPGNRSERGEATISSILGYTGKGFSTLKTGENKTVFGWQNIHRHTFEQPMGTRWLANCDIPDLTIFPTRYPDLQNLRFFAGLELTSLHLIMWLMSGLSRIGIIRNWAQYSSSITKISYWFKNFGTNIGGMYMTMEGCNIEHGNRKIVWELIALNNDGPNIPTIFAVILAKKIASHGIPLTGAMPCIGLVSLEEFTHEMRDLAIFQSSKIHDS